MGWAATSRKVRPFPGPGGEIERIRRAAARAVTEAQDPEVVLAERGNYLVLNLIRRPKKYGVIEERAE
jgi:hypothetical protein